MLCVTVALWVVYSGDEEMKVDNTIVTNSVVTDVTGESRVMDCDVVMLGVPVVL